MLLITFDFIKKNGNSRIYTFYTSKSIFGIKSFGILNLGIIKLYKTTNFIANKCSPPLMNSSNETFYHITSYPIYFISQQTTSKLSTSHSCSLRISKFTEFRIFYRKKGSDTLNQFASMSIGLLLESRVFWRLQEFFCSSS